MNRPSNRPSNIDDDLVYRIRHTAAHVMAKAVLELYPQAKLGIGPPIADGFYYDFDLGVDASGRRLAFSSADLEAIEQRMRGIIGRRYPLVYRVVSPDQARELFREQPYKLELITDIIANWGEENGTHTSNERPVLSTYRLDDFEDLCRGPHVEHTGQIPLDAFKLTSVTSAYWRGSEKNPSQQRIYGTAWQSRSELESHLASVEEARNRDHRRIGRELDIFTFDDEVGSGLPLWLPHGTSITEELEKLAKEVERRRGYQRVRTPNLAHEELFVRSGHLPYYADSMFPPMELEGERYYVKPMNCPFHHKIFASRPRSYRELPLRLAEYGTCYRYEKSGELMGLLRSRMLQMNDAHIYCTEEQFESEFLDVVSMYLDYFALLGIEKYLMRFSTHSERGLGKKYVDNERLWTKTEGMARRALVKGNVAFVEVPDEAAFYGPKIDVQVWSAIGKEFTLATNQVDFVTPSRFELTYTNKENGEETPLCIHRAPLSTHERLVGFLIEHYAGKFPTWLAPEQVRIIPITDNCNDYAARIFDQLFALGIRASADYSSQRMNAKVRAAQVMKVPYMLIVGEREVVENKVALRTRDNKQEVVSLESFVTRVQEKIRERSREL